MMNDEMRKSLSGEIGFILRHNARPGTGDFWGVIQRAYLTGRLDQATEVNRRTAYEAAVIAGMIPNPVWDMGIIAEIAKKMADIMLKEDKEEKPKAEDKQELAEMGPNDKVDEGKTYD